MILGCASLVPALVILAWAIRQPRTPLADASLSNVSKKEAVALRRVLQASDSQSSASVSDDAVSILPSRATLESTVVADGSVMPPDLSLDRSWLHCIDDAAFGIPPAESAVYERILDKLRGLTIPDLEAVALKSVPFAVLMLQPDRFRGKLLTVEGDIRRITRLDIPGENSPPQFDAWLFTVESGVHPYRVVFTTLPTGVGPSDTLSPPVHARVTGYFFKRYSYATADNFHTAPLILAKTLTVLSHPTNASKPNVEPSRWSRLSLVLAIACVLTVVVLVSLRQPRRRRVSTVDGDASAPNFEWLQRSRESTDQPTPDVPPAS
jgi:hypothetical protein